jgi:outer membrane protein assembly factor BamB
MNATEPDPSEDPEEEPRHSHLLLWLAGALALLLCAGLVVQIGYRPDGWSGMYADAVHGGFRGPYGGYPHLTDPGHIPSAYRAAGTSRAGSSYLLGGLRIDTRGTRTNDVTATRTTNGTRYWQYHKGGDSKVTKAAVDRARGDLFLAWRSRSAVRIEAVDVRAARRRWHQTLTPAAPVTGEPLIFPDADASGQVVTVVWGSDVVGLDRATGHRRWSFPLPSGCTAATSAVLSSPTLVVGLTCGNRQTTGVGLDPATGHRLWTMTYRDWRQITGIGPGLVALTADRHPPVLNAATGRQVRTLPSWNPTSVTDGTNLITLGCQASEGVCGDCRASKGVCGDCQVPKGVCGDCRASGEICAADPATGKRRWVLAAPEGFRFADGVAVDGGRVYALLLSTGHPGYVSVGIADAATGSWLASVPLAATLSERVRTGRIASVSDGILLITTSTGDDLTLVPVR